MRNKGQSMFPVLSGDFFTYADRDDHYWSGYFTSRPFYKRMDRIVESHLRAAEILYYFALRQAQKFKINKFLLSTHYMALTEARRNLGLFQHHDGITGTAKDWVVVDYGNRLFHSLTDLDKVIGDSAFLLILKNKHMYESYSSDPFIEMNSIQKSQDSLPENHVIQINAMKPRYLVIYNPLEQHRNSVVSLYVSSLTVQVLTDTGEPLDIQVNAVWNKEAIISQEAYEISFVAHIPPLGLKVYTLVEAENSNSYLADYILYNGQATSEIFKIKNMMSANNPISLQNSHMILSFDKTGLMETMVTQEDKQLYKMKVQFTWYGTTSKKDKSGAYLFLPDGFAQPYVYKKEPIVRVLHGRIYSEVISYFEHVTHRVRLYNLPGIEGRSVEISNVVNIQDVFNREIAMRISSNINNENRFYTDLNGYQIQPRMTLSKLPLQANVYPMTTMAYIQDTKHRLTLLSAQSSGVSSLKSGDIEVIMDRRLMQDDNRGLGQGVFDNKITASLFRILLEERSDADMEEERKSPVSYPSLLSHLTSSFLNHPVFLMTIKAMLSSPTTELLSEFPPLLSSLPCDIHLVNLRTIQAKVGSGYSNEAALILHRKGFGCQFSTRSMGLLCSTTQGKILVHKLFNKFTVENLIPSSLSLMHTPRVAKNISVIHLSPMEISTFRIRLG